MHAHEREHRVIRKDDMRIDAQLCASEGAGPDHPHAPLTARKYA
jgi:hypothetical protein